MKKVSKVVLVVLFVLFFPVFALAQNSADLSIEKFSVFSTLPEADGFRRVSVSFRVVNRGRLPASATTTRVSFDDLPTDFATPILKGDNRVEPPDEIYITRSTRTRASQVGITIRSDALNKVSEFDEANNNLQFAAVLNPQAGRWQSIGPSKIQNGSKVFGVGRVTTIAIDPRLPTRIYVGARGSGLWKSADNGATWFPIGDSLPSAQIDAIGIYPNNRDRVVVATPKGVFESTDGGSVWKILTREDIMAVGSGGGALLIANKPNPPLYVSTRAGLRVSTDGGRTWPTVLRPGSQVVSLQFSTTDPSHLFASTINPPLLFEAKDGGLKTSSWRIQLGCVNPLPTLPANAIVWIAESKGRRWMSFRAKNGSVKVTELWRSSTRRCEMNGFTDHSWEKVPLSGACGTFENNFSYLFAHPDDSTLVFKGGVELCRSTLSGNNLSPVAGIHVDHHAIALGGAGDMYFGGDGGIYRSFDKGKTMQFLGEGLNVTEFLKIDTDGQSQRFVVGGTQDNGASTWSGISPIWNYIGGGDSSLVAFDRADLKNIFEIGQSTRQIQLIKPGSGSSSLGTTALPDCLTYSETPDIFESMVSTGANPRLFITCRGIWSGGPPWRQIQPQPGGTTDSTEDFTRLKIHPSGIMVAVTNRGRVFHGLFKFPPLVERFRTPTQSSPSDIEFDGPGRFYISTNAGQNGRIDRLDCFVECTKETVWQTNPGEIMAITIDPRAPNTLLAAIRNQGVFRGVRNSPNNWTWTAYNNGLPSAITVTDLQPQKNGGIIAATWGRGAFQLFSQISEPQPPQKASGFVTSYEVERAFPQRPAGSTNPVIETIEIDSKPGFIFTSTSNQPRFTLIVKRARENSRKIEITFDPTGPLTGKIINIR